MKFTELLLRKGIWIILIVLVSCRQGSSEHQIGSFEAVSDAFWDVIPKDAICERIGINFQFTEGPALYPDGSIIFSDIPASTIYQWNGKRYHEFRKPSGNSNGLLVDPAGGVIACEHGSRSITRLSPTGELDTLATHYMDMRFNSPNDLCRTSGGALYFTDPPWGLPGRNDDPGKEIPYNGVYRLYHGEVQLIDSRLSWPNGIALSPDENLLYVANFEYINNGRERDMHWVRYRLNEFGMPTSSEVFFRAPQNGLPGTPDGMKVNKEGILFLTGPGGVFVVSPDGEHLGTVRLPETATNLAFGPREKQIYITMRSMLVRLSLRDRPD
jgi:gluconolactonase